MVSELKFMDLKAHLRMLQSKIKGLKLKGFRTTWGVSVGWGKGEAYISINVLEYMSYE